MFLPLRAETPRLRFPTATLALVLLNFATFAYEMTLSPQGLLQLAHAGGMVPWEVAHLHDLVGAGQPRDLVPPPLTVYTSLFLHGSLLHVGGNMWFLWLFGSALEGLVGAWRFLAFYFVAGTVAAALQVVASPSSTMPVIGASGAIAGVLGAYALSFPRARVRCVVFVAVFLTEAVLPAGVLLVLWFLLQLAASGGHAAGVAWFAHTGGFLTGLAFARRYVRPPARIRPRRQRPAPTRQPVTTTHGLPSPT